MLAQTNESELGMFMKFAKQKKPITKNDIPLGFDFQHMQLVNLKISFSNWLSNLYTFPCNRYGHFFRANGYGYDDASSNSCITTFQISLIYIS